VGPCKSIRRGCNQRRYITAACFVQTHAATCLCFCPLCKSCQGADSSQFACPTRSGPACSGPARPGARRARRYHGNSSFSWSTLEGLSHQTSRGCLFFSPIHPCLLHIRPLLRDLCPKKCLMFFLDLYLIRQGTHPLHGPKNEEDEQMVFTDFFLIRFSLTCSRLTLKNLAGNYKHRIGSL